MALVVVLFGILELDAMDSDSKSRTNLKTIQPINWAAEELLRQLDKLKLARVIEGLSNEELEERIKSIIAAHCKQEKDTPRSNRKGAKKSSSKPALEAATVKTKIETTEEITETVMPKYFKSDLDSFRELRKQHFDFYKALFDDQQSDAPISTMPNQGIYLSLVQILITLDMLNLVHPVTHFNFTAYGLMIGLYQLFRRAGIAKCFARTFSKLLFEQNSLVSQM